MARLGIDRRMSISTLGFLDLFTDCVEIFDIVVTIRNFEREFVLLCTKLSLQRIRFVIWGEALGLLPSPDGVSQPHNRAEHRADIRPALEELVKDLLLVIAEANVFTERFQLNNDTPSQEQRLQRAASVGLPVFHDRFENFKERLRKSRRKQNSSWTVSRWSVYDLGKFATIIDKIKGLLDTLEGMTASLGILEQQQSLLRDEIESITDEASLRLLRDVACSQQSSPVLLVVSDAVNHGLKLVAESTGSKAARSNMIESTQSCHTSLAHRHLFPPLGVSLGTPPSMTSTANISDTSTDHSNKAHAAVPVETHVPEELCEACSTISLSMLVNGFRHALDHDQVLKSKDYCQFCALMMDAYDTQACINHTKPPCDKIHRSRLTWGIAPPGPGARVGMFRLDHSHYGKYTEISTSEESSLFKSGILTQRDLQAADSTRNLRLLRDWLGECRLNHDECRHGSYSGKKFDDLSGSTTLPFRVIDVGSSDGSEPLRLVTTAYQMTGRYLTLSHCWGEIAPTKTMKATLAAWHVALPEKQLSKTFQDAIRLTRELGERFLWIDSLCIAQDDPGDLEAQIGLMGAIFEESYCTIAAVDAKGVDRSLPDRGLFLSGPDNIKNTCLWLRHKSLVTDPRLDDPYSTEAAQLLRRIDGENSSDEVNEVFLEMIFNHKGQPWSNQLQEKAWNSRGWVFQEKNLSRRCIFFTEETVAWKCNRYWETEQTGVPGCRERSSTYNMERDTIKGFAYDVYHLLRMLWRGSVEEYSKTKLTYVADKSKALKGIEERLSTRFGATFRFGLLDFGPQEVLHSQLLWIPTVGRGSSLRGDPDFLCPSWSWMVVNGPAGWTANEYIQHPETLSEVSFGELTADRLQELHISGLCQVIKVGTSIDEIPRFTKYERWPPETHFGWSELHLDSSTNTLLSVTSAEIIGWVMLDTSEEPVEIMAAPLMQYLRLDDEEEPMCVDFLALATVPASKGSLLPGGRETYHRVGRGRVLKTAFGWLESCQRHDIIVV